MKRAHHALALVAAALRDPGRGAVLDVDDQEDSLRLSLPERPLGQAGEDLGRDALAAGGGRNDVAQLDLAGRAIDLGREAKPDEPTVAVDGGEAFPGSVATRGYVPVDPGSSVSRRRRLRDPREAPHLGVGDQIGYVTAPPLIEGLEPDFPHRAGRQVTGCRVRSTCSNCPIVSSLVSGAVITSRR